MLSAEQLTRILNESDLGIVVTDMDGTIMSVTPPITHLTGYSKSELVGANPRMFKGGRPLKVHTILYGRRSKLVKRGRVRC